MDNEWSAHTINEESFPLCENGQDSFALFLFFTDGERIIHRRKKKKKKPFLISPHSEVILQYCPPTFIKVGII